MGNTHLKGWKVGQTMTTEVSVVDLNEIYHKPFLTPKEVAEVLGLNVFTVYNLLKGGELKGVKLGHRTWRIRKEDLDAYNCK